MLAAKIVKTDILRKKKSKSGQIINIASSLQVTQTLTFYIKSKPPSSLFDLKYSWSNFVKHLTQRPQIRNMST